MTIEQAKKVLKDTAVDAYGSIYDDRFKKIAAQAFMDGMVFCDMVRAGAITDSMINGDFFTTLREFNQ